MSEVGGPVAFRIFSGVALLVGFSYYVLFKLYFLPKQKKVESFREEVGKMPIRTVSFSEHRKNSLRYNKNIVLTMSGDPGAQDGLLVVREAMKTAEDIERKSREDKAGEIEGNTEKSDRFRKDDEQKLQAGAVEQEAATEAQYPQWSDDEDAEAGCRTSTPYKGAAPRPRYCEE